MQLILPFLTDSDGGRDNAAQPHAPQLTPGAGDVRLRRIVLGGEALHYRFRRASRRTIGLTVDEAGLAASAPRWVPVAEVEAFIREKERWILRKLGERRQAMRPRFVWEEGGRLPYLGRDVHLAVVPGGPTALRGDRLEVGVPRIDCPTTLRAATLDWLKRSALGQFEARVAAFAPRLAVNVVSVKLSNAKTQWGSCTHGGLVRLNWKLVHFGERLIDYVVAHELAHLRHMNHSPAFWRVVDSVYPDHKAARRELRERGHLIPEL